MVVNKAKPEHVVGIQRISKSLRFNPSSPRNSSLITQLSDEEFLERIEDSNFFYVYEDGGEVLGYLLSIDDSLFDSLVKKGHFHHDEMVSFLKKYGRPFIYGESMGIDIKHQKKGIGAEMIRRWVNDIDKSGVTNSCVMIRHHPNKNQRSINFVASAGFRFSGEEVINNNMIHGIYVRIK